MQVGAVLLSCARVVLAVAVLPIMVTSMRIFYGTKTVEALVVQVSNVIGSLPFPRI